nr:MAG: hypothetical protein H4RhizoLitter19220_000003 [Leviviridae sp.]
MAGSPRPNESRSVFYLKTTEEKLQDPGYVDSTVLGTRFRYSRTWTGTRTPNFGKLKPRRLPVNNHTVSIRDVPMDRLTWLRTDPFSGFNFNWYTAHCGTYSEYYSTAPDDVGSIENAIDNKAVQKLISSIGAGIEGNLAQDVAEFGKTAGMVANAAKAVTSAIRDTKRGNFVGAINSLRSASSQKFHMSPKGKPPSVSRSVAENWLALQYGWKPLLKDIEASLESLGNALVHSALGSDVVHKVTASASGSGSKTVSFPLTGYPNEFGGSKTTTVQIRKKYGIRYVVDSPTLAFLQQTGFTNPVNLAWELLPLSFVVDWFLPVGKYLESFSYGQGLSFLEGYVITMKKTTVVSAVGYGKRLPGGNVIHCESGSYLENRVDFTRSRISNFPVMSAPTLKAGIDNTTGGIAHALNGIALLVSSFK